MTNPITLDGKQYTVSETTTYTMEPGKLYQDSCLSTIVRLDFKGFTMSYTSKLGVWDVGNVCFPLRELILIEEERREINPEDYWNALKRHDYHWAAVSLRKYVNEALSAQTIWITNVDGSVTVYTRSDAYASVGMPWRVDDTESCKTGNGSGCVSTSCVQIDVQLAFMRGSRVEVVE